jgi:hypothetical protein
LRKSSSLRRLVPDERGPLGERVDRDVVEALVLHALGDRRLDAALPREDPRLVEPELVLHGAVV